MTMTDTMITDTTSWGIRPGAAVSTADGHLGHLGRVTAREFEVVIDRTNRRLLIPRELVHAVRADGNMRLAARTADLEDSAGIGRSTRSDGLQMRNVAPDEDETQRPGPLGRGGRAVIP